MEISSINMSPLLKSYNLHKRLIIVDFPEPVAPTIAIFSPGFILSEKLFKTVCPET